VTAGERRPRVQRAAGGQGRPVGRLARLVVAAVVLTACAQGPAVPPGVRDVSGEWEGDWDGGAIGRGGIELTLTQVDTRVVGELRISGAPAISATEGPLEGRVRGDTFSFTQPTGLIEAELAVRDDQMNGYATGRLRMALSLHRLAK
jgi:hypothetical protein